MLTYDPNIEAMLVLSSRRFYEAPLPHPCCLDFKVCESYILATVGTQAEHTEYNSGLSHSK